MIVIKSPDEIEIMRTANRIVAQVLAELRERVKPGVTTADLDRVAEETTRNLGAEPAFKGYQVGDKIFPRSLCISVNDEVVHGIPSERRILREGDIVGLDYGVRYRGFYGDSAITVAVGKAADADARLVETARAALAAGIEQARPGRRMGDISAVIQEYAERAGYSVVRDFVGHGIGRRLHEDPQVPNYGQRDRGVRLRRGMVLAIEPMVNAGVGDVVIKEDGWTAVTADGRRSAHFEHSVAVTDDGPLVLSAI